MTISRPRHVITLIHSRISFDPETILATDAGPKGAYAALPSFRLGLVVLGLGYVLLLASAVCLDT